MPRSLRAEEAHANSGALTLIDEVESDWDDGLERIMIYSHPSGAVIMVDVYDSGVVEYRRHQGKGPRTGFAKFEAHENIPPNPLAQLQAGGVKNVSRKE